METLVKPWMNHGAKVTGEQFASYMSEEAKTYYYGSSAILYAYKLPGIEEWLFAFADDIFLVYFEDFTFEEADTFFANWTKGWDEE